MQYKFKITEWVSVFLQAGLGLILFMEIQLAQGVGEISQPQED